MKLLGLIFGISGISITGIGYAAYDFYQQNQHNQAVIRQLQESNEQLQKSNLLLEKSLATQNVKLASQSDVLNTQTSMLSDIKTVVAAQPEAVDTIMSQKSVGIVLFLAAIVVVGVLVSMANAPTNTEIYGLSKNASLDAGNIVRQNVVQSTMEGLNTTNNVICQDGALTRTVVRETCTHLLDRVEQLENNINDKLGQLSTYTTFVPNNLASGLETASPTNVLPQLQGSTLATQPLQTTLSVIQRAGNTPPNPLVRIHANAQEIAYNVLQSGVDAGASVSDFSEIIPK